MTLEKYLREEYPDFSNQISYFFNNKNCIIFGGLVKSILINNIWNKELDVLCYDYEVTLDEIKEIFPPNSIKDIDVHTILTYDYYKIDICKEFKTNDFSFNSLGIIGDNIVIIPNIFTNNIHELIYQINNKIGLESKRCKNYSNRKLKYEDWHIIKTF